MSDWFINHYAHFFGSDVAEAPEYLVVFVLTGLVIWWWQGRNGTFWRWMMPRDIWTHKSHRIDLMLFCMGRLMVAGGLLGRVTATTLVAGTVAAGLSGLGLARLTGATSPWLVALAMWLAYDFAVYWVHRAFHTNGWI